MAHFLEDSQPKIALVLARSPERLLEFERFLSRRGWIIRLHSDMKSFLNDIGLLKPHYILISIDYRHPHLINVRRVIMQVPEIQLIDFAENQTLDSWNQLKTLPHAHKIYGYLTGPALESTLQRLVPQSFQHPANEKRIPDQQEKALRAGISQIMKSSFEPGDGQIRRPISWTMKLTCIQVKTPVLSGHFVVATGSDHILEEYLMFVVKDAVVSLMKELEYEVESVDVFPVEIRRVNFKAWSEQVAKFLETGVHRGVEVAMAFFPTDPGIFQFEAASDPSFLKVPISDVMADEVVDYDMYLHLPLNGKFILYVAQGRDLTSQQKLGLEARGIRHLHVRDEDRVGVLRDRAARELNRLASQN